MDLHQLVYISKASEMFSQKELNDILNAAKKNNSHQNITGILMYDGGRFIQILEGDKEHISSLFDKIALDKRHTHIRLLYLEKTDQRLFPNWSMNMLNLNVDKPKNLSELKEIISEVQEEKKIGSLPVALKLFKAFKKAH